MATLVELQNLHEEMVQVCGTTMATIKAINGDEDPAILAEMNEHAEVARRSILAVLGCITQLMEIKRENE